MPLRQVLSERALIQLGFGAFGLGCALLGMLEPTPSAVHAAAFMMAVGLIASPVMLSVASSVTPSTRQGAVQALLQAFQALAEGVGPAVFGWLLAALPGWGGTALPGLPFCLGIAIAALGLIQAASAIRLSESTLLSLRSPLMPKPSRSADSCTPIKLKSQGLFDDL